MSNTSATFDVVGIGNAIVDILSFTDDIFLSNQHLAKGSMQLVDEAQAQALYAQLKPTRECSGGSVANTLAGLSSLGARTAFMGKVRNDQLGAIFRHDLQAAGVRFDNPAASSGAATASCLVLVTPDAQRTMATYIGACNQMGRADIDTALIAKSAILYIEGYLWDLEPAKAAIRAAVNAAKHAGTRVAFTLSDTFCVERHREEFLQLVTQSCDIVFCNEAELRALYQTQDVDLALSKLHNDCAIAAVTRAEKGSVVLSDQGIEHVPTQPVTQLVDTTGAGDLYASGFLFSLTRGWELAACAQLGNRCAGQIIGQLGARSMQPLNRLVT